MKKMVIPSIIAKSQKELNERISKIDSKIYQLDIMDGKFVKNKSLMFDFKVPKGKKYEAHLMVKNPEKWIYENENKLKDINTIIIHYESSKNVENIIRVVKNHYGKKVGIAINPKTPIKKIRKFLNVKKGRPKDWVDSIWADMILIMTVNPGKYGSKFLPKTLEKVKELRKLKPKLNIEVDGGINDKTIHKAFKSGANSFIVGSYLQKSENPKEALKKLKR